MTQTLNGAIAAGVKRLVLIGTVYPYGAPRTLTVSEQHPRNPTTFKGRMRKEQEEILLRAHSQGKIEAAILRLPDFYGHAVGERSFLHLLFKAAVSGGTADMIGPIDTPHEFLYVPDLGPVAIDLAAHPKAYGRGWNLAGAGVASQRQIAEQVFAMVGRKPKLRVIGKTALRALGLFNSFMREFVEMHYLQTSPVLLDDSALIQLLGQVRKTPYAEGLRATLEAEWAAAGAVAPLPVLSPASQRSGLI
jgi:nucleoside-diphosphate-sugar epimerase